MLHQKFTLTYKNTKIELSLAAVQKLDSKRWIMAFSLGWVNFSKLANLLNKYLV